MSARSLAAVTVAICAAALLSACGSSSSSTSTPSAGSYADPTSGGTAAPATPATATKLTVVADPGGQLTFSATSLRAKAGTVVLTLRNPSSAGVPHGISLRGGSVAQAGSVVAPGGSSTVTAKLAAGTYTFFCPVPGHEAGGMKGTLTVN